MPPCLPFRRGGRRVSSRARRSVNSSRPSSVKESRSVWRYRAGSTRQAHMMMKAQTWAECRRFTFGRSRATGLRCSGRACSWPSGTPASARKRANCKTQSCSLRSVGPKCADTVPVALTGCDGHSARPHHLAMRAAASAICSASAGGARIAHMSEAMSSTTSSALTIRCAAARRGSRRAAP